MNASLRTCAVVLSLTVAASAQIPTTTPERAGLAKQRLDRIKSAVDKEISQNHLAGAIGLIARRGKIAYFETYQAIVDVDRHR
jgi:hypothetical protein